MDPDRTHPARTDPVRTDPVRRLTCILCPLGCEIEARIMAPQPAGPLSENVIEIKGNSCPRGEDYAVGELTCPRRLLTSTVAMEGGTLGRLPIRTAREIPKADLRKAMAELRAYTAKAPISRGQVVISDIAGTGVCLIATRSVRAKG